MVLWMWIFSFIVWLVIIGAKVASGQAFMGEWAVIIFTHIGCVIANLSLQYEREFR